MITDSFDKSQPIIAPKDMYGEQRHICDVCIITFSKVIFEAVLKEYPCEKVAEICLCNGNIPIYTFRFAGKMVAIYLSAIGSALAATCAIEANWVMGAGKFVMFGSAGSLNQAVTAGKYVIPTAAYRDEGMSYHYAEPQDYVVVPGAGKVAEVFDGLKVPYVKGRCWTTDAIYRETREQMRRRCEEGCIAVEMELAGVQAVCDYYGFELYDFLVTGDVLDQPEYSIGTLQAANHSLDKLHLALAIAAALE